jgi:hypothetical protein
MLWNKVNQRNAFFGKFITKASQLVENEAIGLHKITMLY